MSSSSILSALSTGSKEPFVFELSASSLETGGGRRGINVGTGTGDGDGVGSASRRR